MHLSQEMPKKTYATGPGDINGISISGVTTRLIQSLTARRQTITHLQSRCLINCHVGSQGPTFCIPGHDKEQWAGPRLIQICCQTCVHCISVRLKVFRGVNASNEAKKALPQANHRRRVCLCNRRCLVEAQSLFETFWWTGSSFSILTTSKSSNDDAETLVK